MSVVKCTSSLGSVFADERGGGNAAVFLFFSSFSSPFFFCHWQQAETPANIPFSPPLQREIALEIFLPLPLPLRDKNSRKRRQFPLNFLPSPFSPRSRLFTFSFGKLGGRAEEGHILSRLLKAVFTGERERVAF